MFAEVADGFMQFMGDGIFVAHNVNFDYGFIACEYRAPGAAVPVSEALHLRGNAAAVSGSQVLRTWKSLRDI